MPTDRPYTPAELEAGGQALDAWLIGLGLPPGLVQAARPYGATAAVLDAVLPDHDARVRADGYDAAVAELHAVHQRTGSPAARWAADYLAAQRTARAHATTEGDHHAA